MEQYEFTEEENVEIERMTTVLRWFAILFGIFALSVFIWGIAFMLAADPASRIRTIGPVITGFISMGLAVMLYQPLDNFKRITTTKGNDINELMTAVDEMSRAHNLLLVVLVLFALSRLVGVVATLLR
ncbi:MAG: hypothetical protein AAF614_37550 [Chloroflexota bacterium]